MASPQTQMETREVKGQVTTAEVTHLVECYKLEAQCYIRNHVLMQMAGGNAKDVIRRWHDNVTRANLERIRNVAKEMGVPLPPQKLEDRENQIKEKLSGAKTQVGDLLTPTEAITEIGVAGKHLNEFYTTSFNLATTSRVRDVFREGRERVADQLPGVEEALRATPEYFPIPMAMQIGTVPGR